MTYFPRNISELLILLKAKAVPLHAIKALGGKGGIAPTNSRPRQLDGGEWSAPRPGRALAPGEKTPGTHCTGGWLGPRSGLDTEARGKFLSPLPWIEPRSPGRPARSQTLYCLSYPAHLLILHRC
jgi:hypothetical protein